MSQMDTHNLSFCYITSPYLGICLRCWLQAILTKLAYMEADIVLWSIGILKCAISLAVCVS